jgi:hypothetical protein
MFSGYVCSFLFCEICANIVFLQRAEGKHPLFLDAFDIIPTTCRTHRCGTKSCCPSISARDYHLKALEKRQSSVPRAHHAPICRALRQFAKGQDGQRRSLPIQEHCAKHKCWIDRGQSFLNPMSIVAYTICSWFSSDSSNSPKAKSLRLRHKLSNSCLRLSMTLKPPKLQRASCCRLFPQSKIKIALTVLSSPRGLSFCGRRTGPSLKSFATTLA